MPSALRCRWISALPFVPYDHGSHTVTLLPAWRLGHYEILSAIGAGGMGEIYRARDLKLNRDVAIKVLPASLAQDPDRRARFERKAKAVAALGLSDARSPRTAGC